MITWGIVASLLAILLIVQAFLVLAFARQSRLEAEPRVEQTSPTMASIILCVRGADPSLESLLQSLAAQDYSKFELLIVADAQDDPGLARCRNLLPDALASQTRFVVMRESQRLETCSLKCSAILAACGELAEDSQFVALVDADTLPPTDWLSRLVAPLHRPGVGASTALRWYSATDANWGTHVRYVWNAAAIVQMWWYQIPWGGSLAVRRELLDQGGVLDVWKKTFCEDTPLVKALRKNDLRLAFNTQLVMDNRESITLPQVVPWVKRQLLTARLHHQAWPLVLSHAIGTSAAVVAMLIIMGVALAQQAYGLAFVAGATWVIYEAAMVALVILIDHSVRRSYRLHRPGSSELTARPPVFTLLVDILASQICYPIAAVGAVLTQTVDWRRIRYRVGTRRGVKRLSYEPYGETVVEGANESL